eukprot:1611778-Karenia_brevis.AAC.1
MALKIIENSKRVLLERCRELECRIQTKQIGVIGSNAVQYWVQSIYTGVDKGGNVWTKRANGVTWMSLGE